jgi:hypothetical protein
MGANGKMEIEKVPQAGFKIEGLNMAGIFGADAVFCIARTK